MSTSLEALVAQMTVAELAQRSGRSVSQLVELVLGSGTHGTTAEARVSAPTTSGRKPRAKKAAKGRPAKAAKKAAKPAAAKPAAAKPAAAKPAAAKPAAAKPAAKGKAADVDTRNPKTRQQYEQMVLEAIRAAKGRIKAVDLRARLGGSPLQARAAIHRLIDSGKVKRHGKARGTSYTAA